MFSLVFYSTVWSQQQIIDLTTGSTSGVLQPFGANDDTWQVQLPNGTIANGIVCTGLGPWGANPCGRWITSVVDALNAPIPVPGGAYIYQMSFNANQCLVNDATITLNFAGADNNGGSISINGNAYAIPWVGGAGVGGNFNPLTTNVVIPIAPAQIVPGVNVIQVLVNNAAGANSFTGLLLCGNLTINYTSGLVPAISGSNNVCSGQSLLTFTGDDGPGNSTNHYWEITQCDAAGVPTGAYTWNNNWDPGSPGVFTFANPPACNKYYKIKLAVQNDCAGWVPTERIIFFGCTPTVDVGADVNICQGQCVNIGYTGSGKGTSYTWWTTNPNGYNVVIGYTQQLTVCPATTTTYTLTATNTVSGCSVSDAVTVNVNPINLDPDFHIDYQFPSGAPFFNLSVYTYSSLPPGAHFLWKVEALDVTNGMATYPGSVLFSPSVYMGYPNPTASSPLILSGYDFPFSVDPNGLTPYPGRFYMYHPYTGALMRYRITRGVWMEPSDPCNPYEQQSYIVGITPIYASSDDGSHGYVYDIYEDTDAPDYSNLLTSGNTMEETNPVQLKVYPNPSSSIFNIGWGTGTASLEVYDMLGNSILSEESCKSYLLDLSGYAKGIYLVNVISEGKMYTQKIILE